MADPGNIKFPVRKATSPNPPLVIPRRRQTEAPFAVSQVSQAARESIRAIVTATRESSGTLSAEAQSRSLELERSLRQLELRIEERERLVGEREARLAEIARDLAETEALLVAREQVIESLRKRTAAQGSHSSPEERDALLRLRAELDRQETLIKEGKQTITEREHFLEESETKLFEKVQAQQEKEIELDQKEEDLRARERRLREREAAIDPAAAEALKADDEKAKIRDEFNE